MCEERCAKSDVRRERREKAQEDVHAERMRMIEMNDTDEHDDKMNEKMKEICEAVLSEIKPKEDEMRRVKEATEWIIRRINERARELNIPAVAVCVGSVARNTWIRGEEDIDIFIMLPEKFTEEELEEIGLKLAKSVASRYEERYASHPYIHASFSFCNEVVEADIVPCFAVRSASEIKSAVDRTPFHNAYLCRRIIGFEDDVRLLKQFLKAHDIYGAEQRTMGFSGYLCELLILYYRGFIPLLKDARHWRFGHRIDMEGHGTYKSDGREPLIVIDPVDPKRNVAASVSAFAFARFIDAARSFIREPSTGHFFRRERAMSREAFIRMIMLRGTDFVMLCFDAPPVVDDVLFPQLRKAERSLRNLIEHHEFSVMRSAVGAEGGKAFIIYEIACSTLPAVKMHAGPPVTSEIHAERFKKKHENHMIRIDEQGRLVAEVPRKYRSILSLLRDRNELLKCGLGKHISEIIANGRYEVMMNDEIKFFEGLGKFLKKYFSSTVS